MNRRILKDTLGWGIVLWLVGYVLGIVLFMFVPPAMLGWIIMPIGTALTIWVLVKRVKASTLSYCVIVGSVWTIIAVVFDYLFLVRLLKPADGYYKPDVYLYYFLTFVLPLVVGWYQKNRRGV